MVRTFRTRTTGACSFRLLDDLDLVGEAATIFRHPAHRALGLIRNLKYGSHDFQIGGTAAGPRVWVNFFDSITVSGSWDLQFLFFCFD